MKRDLKNFYWKNIYPLICFARTDNHVANLIRKYGGSNLNIENLKKLKKSDTIFVLGTGQSLNNFTNKEWDEISTSDSIAINDFCLMNFAPTFYSFELERQNREDHLLRWERNAKHIMDSPIFNKTFFLLRPYEPTTTTLKKFVSLVNRDKRAMWHRIDKLPGYNIENIADIQVDYVNKGVSLSNYYYPSRGSSLSWILYLIHKLEYKNIVLCGIDLHGDHFWKNSNPITQINFENKHETAIQSNGIGVEEIIDSYNKSILLNTKLFVSTKYSLLSNNLPIYFKNI